MPTTHVKPDSESLLEDIANSLWKARKVVVITGAGISTNSGIPDFRSENGLYSLIQAQFDAVDAKQQSSSSTCDVDESDASSQLRDELRAAKRRRISRGDTGFIPQSRSEPEEEVADEIQVKTDDVRPSTETANDDVCVLQAETEKPSRPARSSNESPGDQVSHEASLQWADKDPAEGRLEALTPLPSPRLSPGRREMFAQFASSPPSLSALQLRSDSGQTFTRTMSSSPLSSPPPITHDPYHESLLSASSSSSSASSGTANSSRSQSEERSSVSTPLLTSQSSFASSSSRTTLPNMKGKDLFDAQIWSCPQKTSVFYTFTATLRDKAQAAEPTSSHRFVSVLRDSRKLVRCYTQNIDQLEERVGLSTELSLGPGSRYRFSHRSTRASGVARASLKEIYPPTEDQSQASQQQGEGSTQPEVSSQAEPSILQPGAQPPIPLLGDGQSQAAATDSPAILELSQQQPDDTPTVDDAATSAPTPAPPKRGVECVCLHGSLAELRCFVCARTASWDEESRREDVLAGRQPTCPHCAGATAAREERGKRALGVGKLRPDIVLYGEEHPKADLISPIVQHDLSLGPDMLLILGTSMRVHGLKVLVKEFAKAVHERGGKVVFVNFTKPADSVWSDVIDYWVQWDCDAWVGNLQKRKPALWLPLGAALPEDEKSKPAKASRRQSGEANKRKQEGADLTPRKRRDAGKRPKKAQASDDGPTILEEITVKGADSPPNQEQEVDEAPGVKVPPSPPPPPPSPHHQPPPKTSSKTKALPKASAAKVAKFSREPKLNPNAKRPMSVRDHKMNGAYLTWKILKDLRRIVAAEEASFAPSTPIAPMPRLKSKRSRKSAPGALGTQGTPMLLEQASNEEASPIVTDAAFTASSMSAALPPITAASAPTLAGREKSVTAIVQDSSITEAVKTRNRKKFHWIVRNGVETRVVIDSNISTTQDATTVSGIGGEAADTNFPPTQDDPTVSGISGETADTDISITQDLMSVGGIGEAPAAPMATPMPHTDAVIQPTYLPRPQSLPKMTSFEVDNRIANGFRETDSLIAIFQSQIPQTPLSTKPLHLPLLNDGGWESNSPPKLYKHIARPTTPSDLPPLKDEGWEGSTGPKLQPLEPKVSSPEPHYKMSPNAGSPITWSRRNPFFLTDALAGCMTYPPPWRERASSLYEGRYFSPKTKEETEHDFAEQDAALMLSVMRFDSAQVLSREHEDGRSTKRQRLDFSPLRPDGGYGHIPTYTQSNCQECELMSG
ncbi:hypothetical protein B0H63DRAFT_98729 [Podospora didyma]|uniref:Deacetylase sirtuin-type domain-containing protein n=1 Tax=Podospora didyma TaxID=330526 RepID=A0AAE0NX45_9PEZI|nr:hypothetical protein B0H63DRAFT_98729 [Podospora didyma]